MNPNDPVAADPVVSPADTLRQSREAFVQYIALKVPEGFPVDRWIEYEAAVAALLAVGERDKAEIDGLVDEVRRLADRAVCSGCGSDVGESGICTYSDCDDGEMIPASDMPWALRKRCDDIQEERAEWRSDWEALRAEAKALEVAGERDRRRIAQLTEALTDAQQLLARFEYLRYGSGARRPMDGETETSFACPVCGWPQGGHNGLGRYKGNAENTHEEGCSLYAVLHGLPAPRLLKCNDRPARAVLAGEEDARP